MQYIFFKFINIGPLISHFLQITNQCCFFSKYIDLYPNRYSIGIDLSIIDLKNGCAQHRKKVQNCFMHHWNSTGMISPWLSSLLATISTSTVKWNVQVRDIFCHNQMRNISTVKAPNFDSDSYLWRGARIFKKNCRCFMDQDRQTLSKAFQSQIYFAVQEKIKIAITILFIHFS